MHLAIIEAIRLAKDGQWGKVRAPHHTSPRRQRRGGRQQTGRRVAAQLSCPTFAAGTVRLSTLEGGLRAVR